MFTVLNRYIIKSISAGLVLSVSMFLTLTILLDFIKQVSWIGTGDFTLGSAIFYIILTIPSLIFDYFPVSGVVGLMLGLGALAANSELLVIQSYGISRIKLTRVVALTFIVWLVPLMLMGEYIAPPAKLMAESYRSTKISKDVGLGLNSGVWLRDGNVIFNATPIGNVYDIKSNDIEMSNVTVYELDDRLQVIKVSKAQKAKHTDGSWELFGLEVTDFNEFGVKTHFIEKQIWPSRIKPEILSITNSRPKYLSIRDILKYKKFKNNNEHVPAKYGIALWSKIAFPLLVLTIALSGLPFVFGLLRSGGFGQRLLIGIMLGVVLYLMNRMFLNVGEVFHIHPVVVSVLPPAVILTFILALLKRQKK